MNMLHVLPIALLAAACAGAAPPAPSPAPAPQPSSSTSTPPPTPTEPAPAVPEPAPTGSLRERLMQEHFTQTVTIREALIRGEMEKTVKPALALSSLEGVEDLPEAWETAVRRLLRATQRISEAPNLQEASAATADIGRACGACHQTVGALGDWPLPDPAPSGDDMKSRMARHRWGTERLWEGLFVPSAEAWSEGASLLADNPMPKPIIAKGGVHALSAAERFGKLMDRAKATTTAEARAEVYAEVLTTCAPCHGAIGDALGRPVGPGAEPPPEM